MRKTITPSDLEEHDEDNILYIRDGKLYYKERQCPFCNHDMQVIGKGKNFVHLQCTEHEEMNLYIIN